MPPEPKQPRRRINRGVPNINGEKIWHYRRLARLTTRTLAELATATGEHVARSTLSAAESGTPISPPKLQAIAEALATATGDPIKVADLLKDEEKP